MNNKIQIIVGVILFFATIFCIPYIYSNYVLDSFDHTFIVFMYLWGLAFSFILIVDGIRTSLNKEELE